MKYLLFLLSFLSTLSYSQDDELIYLTFRKQKDSINLYCVNKNPVDYFIYVHFTTRDIKVNPKDLKRIVKSNDSLFVTKLTSYFSLANFDREVILYKQPLIEIDSAQAFKNFKTPIQNLIEKNQLIVFVKRECPDCSEITNYLNLEKLPSKQIDVQLLENSKKYQETLDFFEIYDKKITLPLIVFEGKPYYHLKKKEKTALLEDILQKLKDKRYQNTKRRYQ